VSLLLICLGQGAGWACWGRVKVVLACTPVRAGGQDEKDAVRVGSVA
jgi:hypothetical protein